LTAALRAWRRSPGAEHQGPSSGLPASRTAPRDLGRCAGTQRSNHASAAGCTASPNSCGLEVCPASAARVCRRLPCRAGVTRRTDALLRSSGSDGSTRETGNGCDFTPREAPVDESRASGLSRGPPPAKPSSKRSSAPHHPRASSQAKLRRTTTALVEREAGGDRSHERVRGAYHLAVRWATTQLTATAPEWRSSAAQRGRPSVCRRFHLGAARDLGGVCPHRWLALVHDQDGS